MKAKLSTLALHHRRRRLRLWQVLAVAVLCGGLMACSGMTSKPAEPTDPTKPTMPEVPEEGTPADAVELSLRAMIVALVNPESLVAPQTSLLPPDVPAGAEALIAPCPMTSTGDATDSDVDNYPVNETRTFDCDIISESPPLIPFSFGGSGSLALTDKDDMDAASGVTAAARSVYTMSADGVPLFLITVQVTLDAAASDAGADYTIDYEGSGIIEDPYSRNDLTNEYDVELTGSFPAGSMTVAGMATQSVQPKDCAGVDQSMREECQLAVQSVEAAMIDLEVTSAGLTYDAGNCSTIFTGGSFQVSSAGNVVMVSYSACGERSVTLNGQPVTPAGS